MRTTFERVTTQPQVHDVVRLANTIWTEHYTPIIGKEQVVYMLTTYHSSQTITKEIANDNIHYYLIFHDTTPVGYMGIRFDDKNLFLSKLYLLSDMRGCGFGKEAIGFISNVAVSHRLQTIILTVNKNNTDSIAAYTAMGFITTRELRADIGEGYVMDDYVMELDIAQKDAITTESMLQ